MAAPLVRLLPVLLLAGCLGAAPPEAGALQEADAGPEGASTAPAPRDDRQAAPAAVVAAGPAASDVEPSAPDLVQDGCRTLYLTVPTAAAAAADDMPEGFSPRLIGDGVTVFMVKAWVCASSTGPGIDVADGALVIFYWAVQPPAHLQGTADGAFWLPLDCAASHEELAAAFAAWDIACRAGDVRVDVPSPGLARATVDVEGYRLEAAFALPPTNPRAADPYLARYFGVRDGVATTVVDIPVQASRMVSGPATLVLRSERFDLPRIDGTAGTAQLFDAGRAYDWIATRVADAGPTGT